LVAGSYGAGRIRGSSNLRRIASVFSAGLEGGDPAAYAPHYFKEPYEELGGKPSNVLLMPVVGDTIVPVSTGITQARVAGLIEQDVIDPRYDMTVDQWLVDRGILQGIVDVGPYLDVNGSPCLFDPDDLDNGTDGTGAPSDAPLRLTMETASGVSALRLPYVSTRGSHGFSLPNPSLAFDHHSFALNTVVYFLLKDGKEISDDPCMADFSCDWMPELDINTEESE
jgi:hypothetical protein